MDVRNIITQQAEAAGVDPNIALSIAQAESSLNPSAKNPNSSAAGLFQVIDSTWSQYGGAKGKKLDPQENARVGVSIISDNAKMLRDVLGRDPSASDIYATHVFGPTGGKKLLSASEDTPINQILSKNAIKANRLQGKTAGDVLAWIESKVPSEKRAKPVSQKTPVPPAADTPFQLGPDPRLVAQGPRDAVAMTADLGPGYQAALGAMYLADENEDKDPDAGELSVAEQYLATGEGPKTASMMKKMADELALSTPAVVGMADGGMVEDPEAAVFADPSVQTGVTAKEMLKGMGSTYYDMAKGATQATVGLPGDIELFGRILSGQEDPDTIFPTTDEAKAFIDRIAPALGAPTAPEGRTPGEAFGEWMDISGLAKPAVAGAKAAGRAAKNLATSEPAYRMLERMAEPSRSYAVRPPGGIMPSSGSVDEPALSSLDTMLEDAQSAIYRKRLDPEKERSLVDFIDTKARKYFMKDVASTKDPIYSSLKEGRIKPLSTDVDFREYMLSAAREGNPQALEDLAKKYDRQLQVGTFGGRDAQQTAAQKLEALLQQTPSSLTAEEITTTPSYLISDLTKYRTKPRLMDMLAAGEAPSHLQMAMEKSDPVFDIESYAVPKFMRPEELLDELAKIPTDKLAKMSYPEAVAAVNKNWRFTQDFKSAVDRVKQGKEVPKQTMLFGTRPVLPNPDGTQWYRLTDSHAALMEGTSMGHSVGGYHTSPESYNLGGKKAFDAGFAEIYSVRDKKGIPQLTVEVANRPNGKEVTQIQGPRNEMPSQENVLRMFNFLDNNPDIVRIPEYQNYWNNTGSIDWQAAYDAWKSGQ